MLSNTRGALSLLLFPRMKQQDFAQVFRETGNAAVLLVVPSHRVTFTPQILLFGMISNIIGGCSLFGFFATSGHIFSRTEVLHFDRRTTTTIHDSLCNSPFPSLE